MNRPTPTGIVKRHYLGTYKRSTPKPIPPPASDRAYLRVLVEDGASEPEIRYFFKEKGRTKEEIDYILINNYLTMPQSGPLEITEERKKFLQNLSMS